MKLNQIRFSFFILSLLLVAFVSAEARAAAPSNDDLANAATLSGASGSINGNTVDATRQLGEPTHDTSSTLVHRTAWYQWTATEDKPVVFEIASADFDAAIAVYVGGVSFPFSQSTTRNNDTFGNRPRVEFGAVAGTTYKIVVGIFNNPNLQGGNFMLQWSVNNIPTNDDFANALTLENVKKGSVTLTKQNAAKQSNEPLHIAGNKSVWFNFTNNLPNDYSITFSTLSFDLADTTISVYTGSSVDNLTPVVKNDNIPTTSQGRVTFLAKSGVTYRIAVDEGMNPNSGNSLLNWGITKIKGYTDFAFKDNQTKEVFYDDAADISVFRPSDGVWYWLNSISNAFNAIQFGASGDTPVAADYDGDGVTDIAVTRNTDNGKIWYIRNSFDESYRVLLWGLTEDKPVIGDYDFDGRVDIAVFRSSEGNWYILRSLDNSVYIKNFGFSTDIPVAGDFQNTPDGTDIAVFRPSNGTWYVLNTDHTIFIPFGQNGDKPVVGEYDSDGKSDVAVYRPSEGTWYIQRSRNNQIQAIQWGLSGDIPMTGDYDNNSNDLYDLAVYRPSEGRWYILKSEGTQTQFTQFGLSQDIPVSSPALLAQ